MGVDFSSLVGSLFPGGNQSPPAPPPKVVLVPPYFQRDVRGLSRFCRSSYPYLANRKQLSRLLQDHLTSELRGTLLLSPHEDPRVSVRAKMRQAGGSMVLRWQPASAAAVHTFLEMAASLDAPGDVSVRGSYLHPGSGLGAFVVAPLAKQLSGELAQVGVRYSSTSLTAGAIFKPRSGALGKLWLAGRAHGVTLGMQLSPPETPVRQLLADTLAALAPPPPAPTPATTPATTSAPAPATSPHLAAGSPAAAASSDARGQAGTEGWPVAAEAAAVGQDPVERLGALGHWLRSHSSLLLAYSPVQTAASGAPPFTAAVEMDAGQALTFSFFQHVAATRQVMNPFEEGEVVGITNYLDIGLQLKTPIGAAASSAGSPASGGHAPASAAKAAAAAARAAQIDLAASWQVNKNWLLKARVGSDGAAAAVGARVWHAVSAYLTASVSIDYATRTPRYGAELCVENFGPLRYERGMDNVPAGRALLQLHEASPQDLANYAGRGVLVRRAPAGDGSSSGAAGGGAASAAASREQAERRRVAELM